MSRKHCIAAQIVLLAWFFLDMTGIYFSSGYLVTRSYKDDGIYFVIYSVTVLLFAFKNSIGKWAVTVWSLIWFVVQFLCHEWYTIFGKGVMGSLEGKFRFFSGSLKWYETESRYIPDVYHTILHILILYVLITSVIYIRNTKKQSP